MKKLKFLLPTILALLVLGCGKSKVEKDTFSAESLSHEVVALNGKKIAFSEVLNKHKGKTIVIEVWASWCSDCIKAMPKIKELQAEDPEIKYIFLSMDKNAAAWKKGIEQHSIVGDHYWAEDGMKGAFAKSINVSWIPRYIIIDKEGNIALYNAIETDFDKIKETLKNIK